jgi:hypothetical protein
MRKKVLPTILAVTAVTLFIFAVLAVTAIWGLHKNAIEAVISNALGVKVKIAEVRADIKNGTLHIKDLAIYNPRGFTESDIMAYLPEVSGQFTVKSLIAGNKLHFTSLRIHVKATEIVKNKNGKLNVEQLAIFKEPSEEFPMVTDRFILTADAVIYKDLSGKGLPHTEAFVLNVKDKEYSGFPTLEDVASKIVSEIVGRTTIQGAALVGLAVAAGAAGGWAVIIPAEAIIVMSGKGAYKATVNAHYADVYGSAVKVAHDLGKYVKENKERGTIAGRIDDANVSIIVESAGEKTHVTVSARGFAMPKLNVAGGILYEIVKDIYRNKTMLGNKIIDRVT